MPNSLPIALLHGPNFDVLEHREAEHYRALSLPDIVGVVAELAGKAGFSVVDYQSNHEGKLIEQIHQWRGTTSGLLVNLGGFSHTSVALLDALHMCESPIIEVHLSAVWKRESFRQTLLTAQAADGVVSGLGIHGYKVGTLALLDLIAERQK